MLACYGCEGAARKEGTTKDNAKCVEAKNALDAFVAMMIWRLSRGIGKTFVGDGNNLTVCCIYFFIFNVMSDDIDIIIAKDDY